MSARTNPRVLHRLAAVATVALVACQQSPRTTADASNELNTRPRLPTGAHLDPVATAWRVGSMPLAMALAPGGNHIVVLLNGWREQGIQIIDRRTGQVAQTVLQPAAFLGLVFSPDGRSLYSSGVNEAVVYRYDWAAGHATLADSFQLAVKQPNRSGTSYPAGI